MCSSDLSAVIRECSEILEGAGQRGTQITNAEAVTQALRRGKHSVASVRTGGPLRGKKNIVKSENLFSKFLSVSLLLFFYPESLYMNYC